MRPSASRWNDTSRLTEVVLVAAVGVARGVGVVLEEEDVAGDPVLPEPLLGLVQQVLDDALARLVVDDQVGDVVALGRGVLGMEAGVEVEAGAVLEEDVGVAGAGDDLLEEVARDVVGREPALAVQGAGEAVLVLDPEDPALHLRTRRNRGRSMGKISNGGRQRNQGCGSSARSWWSTSGGMRRNLRRSLLRSSTATSRSRSVSVLFWVTMRARTPSLTAAATSRLSW